MFLQSKFRWCQCKKVYLYSTSPYKTTPSDTRRALEAEKNTDLCHILLNSFFPFPFLASKRGTQDDIFLKIIRYHST